jgi:acyl-coenzyme A synthetase/AMP-(fatty) acid ligase
MSLVRAKKNPITGALVIADVVLKPQPLHNGAQGDTVVPETSHDAILQFCRTELEPHKVPAAIHIVPSLTIGESGKLVRRHA